MGTIIILEILIIFFAIIFGVKWVINPASPIEPIISLCTILITGIDVLRRSYATPKIIEAPLDPKPKPTERKPIEASKNELTGFKHGNSCAFFSERFSLAFPGIREPKWFYGQRAIERLSILLDMPLKYSLPENAWIAPISWIRDGQMPIEQFEKIDDETVLIETKELKIKRIFACPMQNYKSQFVYLEAHAMPSTGLYPSTVVNHDKILQDFGYVWEEYGLFKGIHPITREEHDDNAAVIMGKPVKLHGESKIRTRYTSPYNMLICATGSTINQAEFDSQLEEYLNSMLEGKECMNELIEAIKILPPSRAF